MIGGWWLVAGSDAYMVALLVRSGFILMELGSRPLRNAKKVPTPPP